MKPPLAHTRTRIILKCVATPLPGEVGPGWKPPAETIAREKQDRLADEMRRRQRFEAGMTLGAHKAAAAAGKASRLGWVAQANKFQLQARHAPRPS